MIYEVDLNLIYAISYTERNFLQHCSLFLKFQ